MQAENNKIGYYLERTTRLVKLNFHQAFKNAGFNITPEQWVILDILNSQNGLSQSDLAEQSFKDAPSISRIIDTLARKSFVERKPVKNDRRKFEIFLTEDGIKTVKALTPLVNKLRNQSWQGLSKEDYTKFLKIINKIFDNMSKE
ncbi:MarR family winged helix-turn-helix transcriptional regulator [Portibacter lacus]|uniref:Transcriptional regulator n=1 Tax=Portibacter lacus TaxID=1099794 RepID=A0AA37SNR7_9BACT|nr:MarR family transcriptional regulator [Portibacter lacus]GLR17177.1 transcriptional regulator [Portibacter lacus]